MLFLLLFTAAFSYLFRFYSRRFEDFTGPARWIWASHQVSRNEPVVFFATRDFVLPANRRFAHLKIFAEPEYTLWFNSRAIASRRAEDSRHLDEYDVSAIARTGSNRVLVAVRSTNGVGGLIAGLDIAEGRENVVVTDGSWKIFRRWNDLLPLRDAGLAQRPMILGEPPFGRWDYLQPRTAVFDPPPRRIVRPLRTFQYVAKVPDVRIVEGVAVAVKESARAEVFDFGFTQGRVRLTLVGDQPVPPVVRFRLANAQQELYVVESNIWATPFGAGERTLVEPVPHSFRFVIVFGGRATADVVQ